jgi:hypothetical protein
MSDVDSLDSLRAREIDAHRRAITMHKDAATLFDRLHQPDRAGAALQRAEHARELLRQAIAEQAQAGAGS